MGIVAERLSGSDRRSIGRANEVARELLERPVLVGEALRLLAAGDPVLRARTADALEKAAREAPAIVAGHKKALLRLMEEARQPEVRWHLAQMLPRLGLTPGERRRA